MRLELRTGSSRASTVGGVVRAAVLVALTQGLSACGVFSAGQDPPFPGQEPAAVIRVTSSRAAFIGATVHLTSISGFRTRLGTMSVGGHEEFVVRDVRDGPHRLEAGLLGTGELRSREFMLRGGDAVEWDLESNTVFYRDGWPQGDAME